MTVRKIIPPAEGSGRNALSESELDRALDHLADPALPTGLTARIVATVPQLPQVPAQDHPVIAVTHPPESSRRHVLGWAGGLSALAAGVAAIIVLAGTATAPGSHSQTADAQPALALANPAPPSPPGGQTSAAPVVPPAAMARPRVRPHGSTSSGTAPAPQIALPQLTVPAAPEPEAPPPQTALASASDAPRAEPQGPRDEDDDGVIGPVFAPGTGPTSAAPQQGYGFRASAAGGGFGRGPR